MIYFDNSATTIQKPPEVARAVAFAIDNFGNAGRSFHPPGLTASREVYKTRTEIAKLIGLSEPLSVAFTSSATESLNLVIGGLVRHGDSIITTTLEHNAVLRPLYLTGCDLSFVDCDDYGNLALDSFEEQINPSTRLFVCTHGSNLTGNITQVRELYDKCKSHNIIMVLDISQTLGSIPVTADMADIFCFTGHKSLFGPQGTGGIITNGNFDFNIVKTGGSGTLSFEERQPEMMPDIFEAGTINAHSIYGLQKGVEFINEVGVDKIHAKGTKLWQKFYNALEDSEKIKIYGDFSTENRLSIVSLNIFGLSSSELAERLLRDYGIVTRPGSHCAPLLHKRLSTVETGIVRFSFSYFNTEEEVEQGVSAIKEILSK
jgi:cysteine desulfurase family protein